MKKLEIEYKDGHASEVEIEDYWIHDQGLLIFEHSVDYITTGINLDEIKSFSVVEK